MKNERMILIGRNIRNIEQTASHLPKKYPLSIRDWPPQGPVGSLFKMFTVRSFLLTCVKRVMPCDPFKSKSHKQKFNFVQQTQPEMSILAFHLKQLSLICALKILANQLIIRIRLVVWEGFDSTDWIVFSVVLSFNCSLSPNFLSQMAN